jgi:hypothetical protein
VKKSHPSAVIDALYSGDVKFLEKHVTEKNVNLVDEYGYTLLSRAATATDVNMKIVRLLLKRGADVKVRLSEGETLLHFACHLLRKDLVLDLLRAGCDPNAVNDAGETVLSKVLWAFNPKKDLIEALIEHGADPKAKDGSGESATEIATRTGQMDLFPVRSGRRTSRSATRAAPPVDNKANAISAIRRHVWAGTYDAEAIAIIVGEEFFPPGQVDYKWVRARIKEAFLPKRAEEATWPAVTDCDRLDRVFEGLETQNILALQDTGLTKSDGLEDVFQEYEDAGGEESGIEGYCFYHGQDLETVMKSGRLWLAFGHISGKNKPGVDIGRRTKRALEAAGFKVEWDGSIGKRMLVKGFRWQRRSP